MFNKLASAVANQVLIKLATLGQIRQMEKDAVDYTKLSPIPGDGSAKAYAKARRDRLAKDIADEAMFKQIAAEKNTARMQELARDLGISNIKLEGLQDDLLSSEMGWQKRNRQNVRRAAGYRNRAMGAEKQLAEALGNVDLLTNQVSGLEGSLADMTGIASRNKNLAIGGGIAAGLGGLGMAGLGIANARKAKQIAQLKKMGLIGGGAGLAGALGLGYLMGDRD